MLKITSDAVEAMRDLVAATGAPDGSAVRISMGATRNGSGPLVLDVAEQPERDDAVLEGEDLTLFVDPGAARVLDGRILHASVDAGEVSFLLVSEGAAEEG